MRPRILLIPNLTELEWRVQPLLEEWADVASYDGPGVGGEPPAEGLRPEAAAERGLAELDRLGWDRCVVVGDELGAAAAVTLAGRRVEAVQALILGHPLVHIDLASDRPGINPAVAAAHVQLADTSFRAFVREQMRAWTGLYGGRLEDADELAERYLARVSADAARAAYTEVLEQADRYVQDVRAVLPRLSGIPKLLVHHEGCLLYTREGFEDAVSAMPDAETASTHQKPSVDPAFDGIARTFVQRHGG